MIMGKKVNELISKAMMQMTLRMAPEARRFAVVKELEVYAMRLGGVDEGRRKATLQHKVTGTRRVSGLNSDWMATPVTTGIMIDAHAVLDVNTPIITIATEMISTTRYYPSLSPNDPTIFIPCRSFSLLPTHEVRPLVCAPSASAKPPPKRRIRSHGKRLAVPQVRMKATRQLGGKSPPSSGFSMGCPLIAFLVGMKKRTRAMNMPTVESEM